MSGYTPVFDSVFTGTLCGKWPDTGLWVCLLAMADRHGVIDKTPQYISAVVGIDVDELTACIERFMQPDPASRSGDEEGRRLVKVDDARSWGWRIVNHGKYREKARKAAYDSTRTETGVDAERKRMSRDVPRCPDASRAVPLSNTNINKEPPNPQGGSTAFDQFWQAYPKKIRKAAAMRVWFRKGLNAKIDEILSHVRERVCSDAQWLAENGRFIPHPATWLNGDGWLDEYERVTKPARPYL